MLMCTYIITISESEKNHKMSISYFFSSFS